MPDPDQSSAFSDCKVVDSLKARCCLFGAIAIFCAAGYCVHGGFTLFALAALLLSLVLFKVFMVNAKGFVIDVRADTLEYPGGGVTAPSVLNFFLPGFWVRYFRRYTLPLSEIRRVDAYSEMSMAGHVGSSTTYYLDLAGEFGAVQFSFMTKGKQDELRAALVQTGSFLF